MLSKVISENQKDWDIHLPKALFAYRTAIHESTGFTPFLVNYGRSGTLPIDVMLGRTSLSSEGGREVPEYVEQVGLSLRTAYNKIRQNIEEAHKANKSRHDRKSSGCNFAVGDLVLYQLLNQEEQKNSLVSGEVHTLLLIKPVL